MANTDPELLLRHCAEDTVKVSPSALADIADQIDSDTCSILETLDEFIYVVDAEAVVGITESNAEQ